MNLLSTAPSPSRPTGGLWHTLRLAAMTTVVMTAIMFTGGVRQAHADPTLMVRNVTSGSFQILQFDAATGALLGPVLAGYDGGFFSSFARGPDKNLYIGRQFDGTIDRYNGATGTFMNVFASTTGVTNLAFGPDGNLYVGRGTTGIFKYDATTGANLGLFVTPPSGASVSGMTFRGGSLYVSYEGGSFYRYDAATGGSPQQIASGLSSNGPRAAGFDGLGSIYLPIWQTTSILRFNEATLAVTGTISTAFGVSPNSLAFDESGTMLVLSDNGSLSRINRYNPTTGAFIDTLVSPGTGGLGRAFDMVLIVPEPSKWVLATGGLAAVAWGAWRRRKGRLPSRCLTIAGALVLAVVFLSFAPAHAVTIDWVTVGDAGNSADTTGNPNPVGAVAYEYRIMTYEWTNSQYVTFLNAVDPQGTNPNGVYLSNMGTSPYGGISFDFAAPDSFKYSTRPDMGDKPVNFVRWWQAARVSNWLHAGGQTYATSASGSTAMNSGAYTLNGATSGSVPAKNPGANFWIPTEDEWYKAAYYKGGGLNAGYWDYATQSDTTPSVVSATTSGDGVVGSGGNFANYGSAAAWGGLNGNVTTVGTNGRSSTYGTFDQSGNVLEWNDLTGDSASVRGIRGGGWFFTAPNLSSAARSQTFPTIDDAYTGFRLASTVAVPEPSTCAMVVAGLAYGAMQASRRRIAKSSRCGLPG